MFEELSARLTTALRRLTGSARLSEDNIRESLREVRQALLEADVHFRVARDIVKAVEARAVGTEVLKSLSPGQQVVKIVHEELVTALGGESQPYDLQGRTPRVLMLVGLQGVGKTTLAGKLARFFAKRGNRPLLVAADTIRPAAVLQLAALAERAGVAVERGGDGEDPVKVAERGVERARGESFDPVILDTRGRLHVDDELMEELRAIARAVPVTDSLLVVDAMVGQDAVRSAEVFAKQIPLGGAVLTKLDGDARGGAALSLAGATGLRVRLVSTGEGLDSLEVFHPERMASRILGMGDVLTLVERAQEAVDLAEAEKTIARVREQGFTLEDFRAQLGQMRKLGPLQEIIGMIPGASRVAIDGDAEETRLRRIEAILNSMTREERREPSVLNGSRRRRIARGSGTSVEEVNRLLTDFHQMERMMRSLGLSGKGARRLPRGWGLGRR